MCWWSWYFFCTSAILAPRRSIFDVVLPDAHGAAGWSEYAEPSWS
jgi:hypothetical protein